MRRKIVVGNWKMNTGFEEALNLVLDINKLKGRALEAIILTPFTHIKSIQEIACANLKVGAQNLSQFENGAYTGEISAEMLASLNAKYVAIGHSERRTIFNETDEIIAAKLQIALKNNLKPILCCGEALATRKAGTHIEFIEKQLKSALQALTKENMQRIILAYEPIWAIGTGATASAAQAQEVHQSIRALLTELYDAETAENTSILYGGSVKPTNAKELFSEEDIDGALVGGASLNAESFVQIIKANNEL